MLSLSSMKTIRQFILILAGVVCSALICTAEEKIGKNLSIDKVVHNFGDIIHKSGSVSCSFKVTNTGSEPAVIYNVVSTCGCTNVDWTREPIRPGQSGKISVTYSNDEGAYPFDKTLTTYTSDSQKPILLKVRGVSIEKARPVNELYPTHFGAFAMKESVNKCGNMEQGNQKTEAVMVANISAKPIKVTFADTDKNLKISVSPNPIPAGGTAEMTYTITADRNIWGKNTYYARPLVDGKPVKDQKGNDKIGFWAFTKENFSHMSQDQKSKGSRPTFKESTYSFGKVRQGQTVNATFSFRNDGKEPFCVYKVDADTDNWSHGDIPTVAPGKEATFTVKLNTAGLPKGEHLTIVTLTTNSPLRPIVNLFLAGYIE